MSESVLIERTEGIIHISHESNDVMVTVIDWDSMEKYHDEALEQLRYLVGYSEFTNLPPEEWARVVKRLVDLAKDQI